MCAIFTSSLSIIHYSKKLPKEVLEKVGSENQDGVRSQTKSNSGLAANLICSLEQVN